MNVIRTTLIVFVSYAYCATCSSELKSEPSDEGPLLLTPFIDAGKLEEAKNRSRVSPAFSYNVPSYAGYLTANRTTKSHLYFWFFPCTDANRTKSAPLVLWLQGGPGMTSLFGLFKENGPFEVTEDVQLRKREHAWTTKYHMLYIDQPVGTGFSFTENETVGYASTQAEVADHLYEVLGQFYKIFDDFKDRDLYIAGESYAGKYVPAIGYKIHTTAGGKVPLKGMMIGNGFSDPENMLEHGKYLYELGFIDERSRRKMDRATEAIKNLIRGEKWGEAESKRQWLFSEVLDALNSTDVYDYTKDGHCCEAAFVEFVSQNQTRRIIHAVHGKTFSLLERKVYDLFEADRLKTVRPRIEKLLEHYPTLFYHGQFDVMVAHPMTEKFLGNLSWSGAKEFDEARRKLWREDNAVAGYYKTAGNLVYVLVRNAGHMVPLAQPKNALRLIDRFVEKKWT